MMEKHRRNHRARGRAAAVTLVQHCGPRNALADAVFADAAVAKQQAIGADEAEIVQGLYDREPTFPCRRVGRGGYQGEGIVGVHYIRPLIANDAAKVEVGLPVPDGLLGEIQGTEEANPIVVGRVTNDFIPMGLEQAGLGSKDLVLASRLLVVIVDREDPEWWSRRYLPIRFNQMWIV
jgi:hypothetical protein